MSHDVTESAYLLAESTQAAPETVKVLRPEEQAYLNALNIEVIYAQKAYVMALDYLRKVYNAPEGKWVLNNVFTGFEQVAQNG